LRILYTAKINSLDGIRRVRVSDDDTGGPQSDFIDQTAVTNGLAIFEPYEVTFSLFQPGPGRGLVKFRVVAARVYCERHQRATGGRATTPSAGGGFDQPVTPRLIHPLLPLPAGGACKRCSMSSF